MPIKVINKAARRLLELELHRRGYMLKPIGNSNKKIDIAKIPEFISIAGPILSEKRTMLGVDRAYVLWQCIRNISSLKGAVAEVGVFRGGGSKLILATLQALNAPKPMYVCDTFEGMPEIQAPVDNRRIGGFEETSFESVKTYLQAFPNATVLKGPFDQTQAQIREPEFCFAHLDVDLYNSFRDCLQFFMPRLVIGGVLLLDDYGFTSCPGAKKAVDECAEQYLGKAHLLHLETGQALLTRYC